MVNSISNSPAPIASKKESNGPSLWGTALSAAGGAGLGYGVYKYEALKPPTVYANEDEFVKANAQRINKYKCDSKRITEMYERYQTSVKETLEESKSLRNKYVAGTAVAITAAYLLVKTLFGGDKSEENK